MSSSQGPTRSRPKIGSQSQQTPGQSVEASLFSTTAADETATSIDRTERRYPIARDQLARLRKGPHIVVRYTAASCLVPGSPSESEYYNSLPKALLEHLCPNLKARIIKVDHGEYVLLESTTRDAVAWLMNWIWAGGQSTAAAYAKTSQLDCVPSAVSYSDVMLQCLDYLHLVIQLGIKGPIRNSLFVALRARIANAGALRAEHMEIIKDRFTGNLTSRVSYTGPDLPHTTKPEAIISQKPSDSTVLNPLSASEQEFFPRFAHDLAILVMTHDVQIPIAAKDHLPLHICISRALHNKEILSRIEAQQATEPLTFSQLDFIVHFTTIDSHTLLCRTVCGGLVRLLETQCIGMTYWDWALKRGWGTQMRRARKDRGAWLIRRQNEEISQSSGHNSGKGSWQQAFRTHRDFWKPVYEAERETRGDVRPARERPSDDWKGTSSSVLGRRHPLPSKPKTTRAGVAMNAIAIPAIPRSSPAVNPTLRQSYEESESMIPNGPNSESQAPLAISISAATPDSTPASTPVKRYVPGAGFINVTGPRSKAAKKNAKKRAKKREKKESEKLEPLSAGDADDEGTVRMEGSTIATGAKASDSDDVREAHLGILGKIIGSIKGGDWAEMGG